MPIESEKPDAPAPIRLIIVGAGPVGQQVAKLAHDVGFEVWVVDNRPDDCTPDRFPQAQRLIVEAFDVVAPHLQVDSNTYIAVVTRRYHDDAQAMLHLVESPACYVGMIGNRNKVTDIFELLRQQGISQEALARVSAPLGLNIGSRTVSEIAISIVAELIATRSRRSRPEAACGECSSGA